MKTLIKKSLNRPFKKGGISIFLVVASCLFVAVIIASFIRLMIRDQQQATNQDLSQSAYDSAQAGVEDAKRFLNSYQKNCQSGRLTGRPNEVNCEAMTAALNKELQQQSCTFLHTAGIGAELGETKIQSRVESKNELDQAYTCVKMQVDTVDYLGDVSEGGMRVLPLKSKETFNKVSIKWFSKSDLGQANQSTIDLEDTTFKNGTYPFPKNDGKVWSKNHPAVLQTQFISYVENSPLTDFDTSFKGNGNGSSTLTLYPSQRGINPSLASDSRTRSGQLNAYPVTCEKTVETVTYACQTVVDLNGTIPPTTQAFLKVKAFYNQTSFSVSLYQGEKLVKFDGVQPEVDSNGRANNQFRRVKSRIEVADTQLPMPDYAIDLSGDGSKPLCKDFWVTNERQEFKCD